MNPPAEPRPAGIRRFRTKLLLAMMLVVSALTSLGIYVAQRRAAADAQADLHRDFQLELASLHRLQDLRNAAVADRSTALARNARIHAALEDNALDLLYPSAREELRDLMERPDAGGVEAADALHARFYRFLDSRGRIIVPPTNAALVLGFKPVEVLAHDETTGMKSGILVSEELHLPAFDRTAEERIAREVKQDVGKAGDEERSLETKIEGVPYLLFFKRLNLHSNYPPAYEICVYPLTQLLARQRQLRSQFLGAGGVLLLGGFVVSHFFSRRLSRPVEKLVVVSEENLAQRQRAEAKLQTTAEELQRSARFSADASHQLKSPITVLRAGLDSLLARDGFPQEVYEEISSLIHQTYRLTGVVEDLLLLSRMDAGKLRLNLHPVDLAHLVAEWIDDLRAMPDAAHLRVETNLPDDLQIAGETKFTSLVVQNLLDNARKYNRRGGVIRISAHEENNQVELRVANTGRGIPSEAQPDIFERFHRAGASEDVPGHGLGLNLARELMRLHGGKLRLVRSDAEWTEFSARFAAAAPAASEAKATR